MEDMIRKSQVLNRMQFRRTEIENNRKFTALKRKTLTGCIDEMIGMVNEISTEDEKKQSPDCENPEEPKTVPKDLQLEPIMIGSNIGIERYRCRRCKTDVDKNDLFCRHCGATFGETIKRRNTSWDTEKHRPAGKVAG